MIKECDYLKKSNITFLRKFKHIIEGCINYKILFENTLLYISRLQFNIRVKSKMSIQPVESVSTL